MPFNDPTDYQPDLDACPSCFLFQATGARCPPARNADDAYNLAVLRMAVQADASAGRPSFADLVRQDAGAVGGRQSTLALPPGSPSSNVNDSKWKEAEYVPASPVR